MSVTHQKISVQTCQVGFYCSRMLISATAYSVSTRKLRIYSHLVAEDRKLTGDILRKSEFS